MCLAVPLTLTQRDGPNGVGELEGVRRKIRLDFLPQAKVGDAVMVHAGFAIEVVDPTAARESQAAYRELMEALNDPT